MTKAAKIIATAEKHPNWSTTKIGEACDCLASYVRVVLRQRKGSGMSDIDRRYLASSLGRVAVERNWRRNAPKSNAYVRVRYATGDKGAANKAGREARRAARAAGASAAEGQRAAQGARSRVLFHTGNREKARRAARRTPCAPQTAGHTSASPDARPA